MIGDKWPSQQPGGLNRYVSSLGAALIASGVDVCAAVLGPAPGAPPWVTAAAHDGLSLPARLLTMAWATHGKMTRTTVVDAHFPLYSLVPVLAARLRHAPVVVHFHGPWTLESRVAGRKSRLGLLVKRAMERAVQRCAGRLVTESAAFKQLLVEAYGASPWIVDVVPPGVDLEHFTPGTEDARRSLGLCADAHIVLAVRRLEARMGLDLLLRAWAEVSTCHPDAELVIAGSGSVAEELRWLANELGVGSTVRFLGKVDDDALVQWYRAADFTVVPSVALEGYGLVVLESAACGTPTLVSDIGGLPEAAAGLGRFAIVPANDLGAWVSRIASVLDGSVSLPVEAACRTYAEQFTWHGVARRHDDVYQAATQNRTDRLRVVYLDHCAELSGGELCLLELLSALKDVDTHVVLGSRGPLVTRLHMQRLSVEVMEMAAGARQIARTQVGARLPGRAVVSTASYVLRLAVRLRKLRPDVVHTNSLKAAIYGGLAGRLAGIPVVWHIHDQLVPEEFPRLARRLVRGMARKVPSAIIANSRSTLALLGDRLPPCTVVPGIILRQRANQGRTGRVENGALRVGMVGRLARWKGQHVFLAAFAQAFPQGEEQAVLVGGALFRDDGYEAELRALVKTLGLDRRVEFRGHCDDVDSELQFLDVFVHASVTPEPFGRVIVEAMAAELPVIATRAGGPMELIDHDRTGILVTPGSVPELSAALRRLAASPPLRARLAKAACAATTDFSEERVVNGVMGVYRQVMYRTGSTGPREPDGGAVRERSRSN